MWDAEAISRAIARLEALMRFEKAVLIASIVVAILLGILHFTGMADVFQSPFIWIGMVDAAIIPIAIIAVFGNSSSHASSNQMKLNDLRRRREELKGKRF